ncbi:MAG TPA: hypothetical protein PKW35_05360 [Nannocystaceae bacterium]|nr:hypothetical protein [Nannocystaceae bacterium]
MKQVVAAFLRHRSAWQLLVIAAVAAVIGLGMIYGLYASTLRALKPALIVVFGTGGAALVMAFVRRAEDPRAREGGAKGWLRFVGAVLGAAGAIAFVTYSMGHHRRDMVAGCEAARLPTVLAEREAEMAEAEARLGSPFALLPALLSDEAARACARSREDLARVERGLCTSWPLVGRECACGEERYPYARCPSPRCLYDPGMPDRFDCPGDPIPEGYPSF